MIVNMPYLTKMFHDSVDYDRIIEIDKQELLLQTYYNLFPSCPTFLNLRFLATQKIFHLVNHG